MVTINLNVNVSASCLAELVTKKDLRAAVEAILERIETGSDRTPSTMTVHFGQPQQE